ncbi:hypothetical protein PHJA_002880800 [Phtheirospermum japonicum]|uniref:Secreted protein n=1 Tax=Phtheirospermum japonicum TaxID=374723 RepID=A0A830D6N1_9LAMI|nr:hypothetical protein PHJA_002880800 [Phtheirospermum japonicum]
MPFKAFSVASLFVGVAISAAMASLHSSGLQSVRYSCCYFVFGVKNPNFLECALLNIKPCREILFQLKWTDS